MKFEIRFYESLPQVCLYTVHKEGELDCETDIFFKKFIDNEVFKNDISEIKSFLIQMGRFGAQPDRFRPEDSFHAIPKTPNNLRLYCIRCSNQTVILCGGGHKTSKKVQDSPDCLPHFKFTKKVDKLFLERVAEQEINYNGRFLDGDLHFDTELT